MNLALLSSPQDMLDVARLDNIYCISEEKLVNLKKAEKILAERGFDPRTCGL